MEAFYTLQGEGFHQGKAAYFIRLAGCDVGCVWCDVKESWNEDLYPLQTIDEIVSKAVENPARLAVITGGEPTLYNLEMLTSALKKEGFQTNIDVVSFRFINYARIHIYHHANFSATSNFNSLNIDL